jgi:hypothetical protein
MIYKMPEPLYSDITAYLSPDKKGLHVNSELDIDDFNNLILIHYGLKDLAITDFPDEEDWETPEYYHFKIINKKLFNLFLLKWL